MASPVWILPFSSTWSPAHVAFSSGTSRSASAVALMSSTPYSSRSAIGRRSFSSRSHATARVMSTVEVMWNWGISRAERPIAAAMACRMRACRSSARAPTADCGVGGAGGAPAVGGVSLVACAAASTSFRWTLPSGPVPVTVARSTLSSRASSRAAGEIGAPRVVAAAGRRAGGDAGGFGDSSAAGAAARTGWAAAPSSRITASGVPTGTLVPSSISSFSITPSRNTSTSMSALSVSTSAMMSPRVTRSPGCLRHATSVPASMSAPRIGITNSAISRPSPAPPRRRSPLAAAPRPPCASRTASAPRRRKRAAPASRGR